MPAMSFREPNQSLWVGCRPGHNGTQITRFVNANGSTVEIYTVTSGKIFYLAEATLRIASQATGYVLIHILNLVPSVWRDICFLRSQADTSIPADHFFSYPPLEVPAGYEIQVVSSLAGLSAWGSIFGWE